MRLLPAEATDDQIVALCYDWVELAARDDYSGALALLWVPPDYDPSQHWSPDSLRMYVANYGSWDPLPDGRTMRITSTYDATARLDIAGSSARVEVGRHDPDRRSGWVDMDLPLNGAWSDLTAQFEFRPTAGGTGVSLYDLHVL
jgi:hypothetical protein